MGSYYKGQCRQRRIRIGFLMGVIFTVGSISPGKPWGRGEGRERRAREKGFWTHMKAFAKDWKKEEVCPALGIQI